MYMPSLYENGGVSQDVVEEILLWPPDIFALTAVLLEETGIYRLVVSPPKGYAWPPHSKWASFARHTGRDWQAQFEHGKSSTPVAALLDVILIAAETPLAQLRVDAEGCWRLCKAILSLNAIADEACVNAGIPTGRKENTRFHTEANVRLTSAGTLAKDRVRWATVLPKLRTPQIGITTRSMSMHVALDRSEVGVNWSVGGLLKKRKEKKLNLLLLPWPLKIKTTDFRAVPGPTDHDDYFEYSASERLSYSRIRKLIEEAKKEVGDINAVILPELAVHAKQLPRIKRVLKEQGVFGLLAGTRDRNKNYAHLARLYGSGGDWTDQEQHKHHRWCIDESQIRQYHLGSSLHPSKRWWENIDIQPRQINFLAINGWLTMCALICEDLARSEPGLDTICAVGPTLVVALLLDGPQLEARWPGRYASVLADDPGSSVLSVTALGMAERSRPKGMPASRVVALWKDARTGSSQIELEPGAQGVVLTLCAEYVREWTADGRNDEGAAGVLSLAGVHQVRC